MTTRGRYTTRNKNPKFDSITIEPWTWRVATAADVSASRADTAGSLILVHATDGGKDEYEEN